MEPIRIDDGTREFSLVDTYGREICKLRFRPADISIMDRYKTLTEDFDSVVAPLREINDAEADGEKIKAVEAEIIRRFNVVLDTDTAPIFAKRSALSAVGGRFFCELVLDAIGGVIADAVAAEAEASAKRIAKYLPEDNGDDRAAAGNA